MISNRASRVRLVVGRRQRSVSAAILFFSFLDVSEAIAQVCCPPGCVQDSDHCVTIGTSPKGCPNTCSIQPPQSGSGSTGNGSQSGSGPVSTSPPPPPPPPPPPCAQPTQSTTDYLTNKCVADLMADAQAIACAFEDDSGRAEDRRTGLTCFDRQAELAKQCRRRCDTFARLRIEYCYSAQDEEWQAAFGDIGGGAYGSAHVQDCGPPLKPHLNVLSWVRRVFSQFWFSLP